VHLQANDGKVLRFWAVWDDRDNLYGDRRPYVVHFYLADDSMEVLEVHEVNSGRDPFPIFIARGPMPKPGNMPTGFSVTKRGNAAGCYCPADLRIGVAIELHGRTMLLYACDTFTRRWYKQNFGYTDEELLDLSIQEEVWFTRTVALRWHTHSLHC
jgi:EF-hand domain-containing protein 1